MLVGVVDGDDNYFSYGVRTTLQLIHKRSADLEAADLEAADLEALFVEAADLEAADIEGSNCEPIT